MKKTNKALKGRFDAQEATPATPANIEYPRTVGAHKDYPEIEVHEDTFTITVKDDEGKEVYKNDKEVFQFNKVPSLVSALRLNGAKLNDDQIQFIGEGLKGSEETGKAVEKLVEVINDDLRTSAKNNAYQRTFNQHKPLTEESKGTATAAIVRNFMRLNNVSDDTAVTTLQGYGVIPKEYTVAEFRAR